MGIRNTKQTVTIANGAAVSDAVFIGGALVSGVLMPDTWTAAGLTFQGSVDGTNFYDIQTSSAELSATAAVDQVIMIDPVNFYGLEWIKVRSGTAGTPVNQAAARVLTLIEVTAT